MPAPRVCPVPGCPVLTSSGRCQAHAAEADRARGSRQARGYDRNHELARYAAARLVRAGNCNCARCGEPIRPDEPWHLDHTDDRTGYLGPSHVLCNLSAAGRAAHA